jgi:S-adenosylmethionine:tRNA ribosyltransferase-isomerase
VQTSDFNYHLPESSIAQTPVEPRDSSRLLVLHRHTGDLEHRIFREIGQYLHPNDLLVLNQTRVIPARIFARKPTGGRVELLLLRRRNELTWQCLVGGKGLSIGTKIAVESGSGIAPGAEIIEVLNGSQRLIRFTEPIEPWFPKIGNVPLPPYIHQALKDSERYQTVYAREPGSAAAPTAGLHFTPRLLEELQGQGVKLAYLTLHVGLDTFAPVTETDPQEHKIHTEWCELDQSAADLINRTKESGGRVIAVGTTSVRTLESAWEGNRGSRLISDPQTPTPESRLPNSESRISNIEYRVSNIESRLSNIGSRVSAFTGPTSLYILPGYQFKVVDAMLTNFHLPKSTLIMLVSAFAGRERVLQTYEAAIGAGYRFYSFGDALLIL